MIILIGDSGATKTEWRILVNGKTASAFTSDGFNPNAMADKVLKDMLLDMKGRYPELEKTSEIHFYGSGLRFEKDKEKVRILFRKMFANAGIFIEHDLTGAVRSTLRSEGIAAILGTGSNACYHRSYEILEMKGGHGYLLGDEGSGMDLGKHLLKSLLQEELSKEVRERIEAGEKKDIFELRKSIYSHKHPNQKLASFAKYLPEMMDLEEIQDLIVRRFLVFIDTTIRRIRNYENLPVDFIGGISYHFELPLKIACDKRSLSFGRVIRSPVDQLVKFHMDPPDKDQF